MDTDDLSDKSYEIIAMSATVSDTLKAELGALSSRYETEDGWLRGVRKTLISIMAEPGEYVDYWNLEREEGVSESEIKKIADELITRVDEILIG